MLKLSSAEFRRAESSYSHIRIRALAAHPPAIQREQMYRMNGRNEEWDGIIPRMFLHRATSSSWHWWNKNDGKTMAKRWQNRNNRNQTNINLLCDLIQSHLMRQFRYSVMHRITFFAIDWFDQSGQTWPIEEAMSINKQRRWWPPIKMIVIRATRNQMKIEWHQTITISITSNAGGNSITSPMPPMFGDWELKLKSWSNRRRSN